MVAVVAVAEVAEVGVEAGGITTSSSSTNRFKQGSRGANRVVGEVAAGVEVAAGEMAAEDSMDEIVAEGGEEWVVGVLRRASLRSIASAHFSQRVETAGTAPAVSSPTSSTLSPASRLQPFP